MVSLQQQYINQPQRPLVLLHWLWKKILGGRKNSVLLFILFLFYANSNLSAQYNLVPNYSFENYTICPSGFIKPPPDPWYMNTNKIGIYSNACSTDTCASVPYSCIKSNNYQPAHTGQAYIFLDFLNGAALQSRLYIQQQLKDSLEYNKCYYIEYFVNLPNTMKYACNNNGLLFTQTAVYVDTFKHPYGVLPANPQILNYGNPIIKDTQNWVKVSSIYVAQGGEKFITIGNFYNASQTSYKIVNPSGYNGSGYIIDDVSVIPLDSMPLKADAGKDTNIAAIGDSVFIGSLTNGITNIAWYNATGLKIDSVAPGFYVHPTASTFYVIEQTVCGFYSRDTVNVIVGTVPLKMLNYELRMLNADSSLRGTKQSVENVWATANELNVSHFNIQRSINGKEFETIGKVYAKGFSYNKYNFTDDAPNEGINYYRIVDVDIDGKKTYSTIKQITIKPQTINGFSVYPNPAKNIINIISAKIKQVNIMDITGRAVMTKEFGNIDAAQMNIASLGKGVFLMKIVDIHNVTTTKKIVIE